jgi:hypothetical protein
MARNQKIPPDPALPRQERDPSTWLEHLTTRLYALLRLLIDQLNLLLDGYALVVATLPTADATHQGRVVVLRGPDGVADKLYVCLKSAAGTYSWVLITTGG